MSLQENLKKVKNYLRKNFPDGTIYNHINGGSVSSHSGNTFTNFSPTNLDPLSNVSESGKEDVDRAVQAAVDSFPDWRDLSGKERRKILLDIASGIKNRAEEIALIESIDTGQAIRFMEKAALRGAENFIFFAEKAVEARDGASLLAPEQINITSRTPIGPVGVITPWNTPFMLSTWKIAPAPIARKTKVKKGENEKPPSQQPKIAGTPAINPRPIIFIILAFDLVNGAAIANPSVVL